MKKVLWISRHQMTPDQFRDLERIMGEEIKIIQWADTVKTVDELRPYISDVDAIAAVLPLNMICELLPIAEGRPVLCAVSDRKPNGKTVRLPDGRMEQQFDFIHLYWEQVERCEIVTRRL